MDEEDVIHIHNGISFSHKKKGNLAFVTTGTELESIMMLSEVSQTEKDKYHMISLMCGIEKKRERKEKRKEGKGRNRKGKGERPSRWRRSETWRSSSSPQIHQKYICMWNNSYRTPTEHWQKISDFTKGKKLPTYLGRAKEKRKNRDKRIGTGPAPLGGSCEGGKVPTH